MATYECSVAEQVRTIIFRQLGGGFSAGSMSSGPYSGLGDETVAVSSDVISASAVLVANMIETASAVDVVPTQAEYIIPVVEDVDVSDVPTNVAILPASLVDAAQASDLVSYFLTVFTSVSEQASVSQLREIGGGFSAGSISSGPFSGLGDAQVLASGDMVYTAASFGATFADTGSASDVWSSSCEFNGTTQDMSVISAIAPTNIVGNSTVINSASYTDFVTSSVVFTTSTTNSANAVDEINARLQWEPVPTNTPTDWKLVNTLS